MLELDDIRPYCTFSTFYDILTDSDVYALKVKHPDLKQAYAVQMGVPRHAYSTYNNTVKEYIIRDKLLAKALYDLNS